MTEEKNITCKFLGNVEPICFLDKDNPASCGHDHLNSIPENIIEKDCYETCPHFRPVILKYGKIRDLKIKLVDE